MNLDEYICLRPFAYHVTVRDNLSYLRVSRKLYSPSSLFKLTSSTSLARIHRNGPCELTIDSYTVTLRDQDRLNPANVNFQNGTTLETYIEYLNSLIFFWPGNLYRLTPRAFRMAHAGIDSSVLFIRVPVQSLLSHNPSKQPLFANCNSGATRRQNGQRVFRYVGLHKPAVSFTGSPGKVVELAFESSVTLPEETEYSFSIDEPWIKLYKGAA